MDEKKEAEINFTEDEAVYFPKRFDSDNHGGMTQEELLNTEGGLNRFPGWQVLVVEGTQETREEDRGEDAHAELGKFTREELDGMTPEESAILHMTGVVNPFDNQSFDKRYISRLLGVFSDKVADEKHRGGVPWSD